MTRNENLYGTKVVQIPPPEFVIFYNGEKDMPEETPLRPEAVGYVQVEGGGAETAAGSSDAQYFRIK